MDGWTANGLCAAGPTADFPELDAQEWQDDEYDQQGHLLDPIKVKERKKRGYRLGVEAEALGLRFPKANARKGKTDFPH